MLAPANCARAVSTHLEMRLRQGIASSPILGYGDWKIKDYLHETKGLRDSIQRPRVRRIIPERILPERDADRLVVAGAQTSLETAITNVPEHQTASATAQQRSWHSYKDKTTSVAPSTQLAACRLSLGARSVGSATITSFTHHPCQRPSILANFSKLAPNRRRHRGERRHHQWHSNRPIIARQIEIYVIYQSLALMRKCPHLSSLKMLVSTSYALPF
jgi:hypothetical protein